MTVTRINATVLNLQCPPTLRGLQAWLVWRYEQHDGEEKPRKVPYYAGGGRRAGVQGSEEDRRKLVTFEAAVAAAARGNFEGIGLATLSGLGVTALDFDNVVGTVHMEPIVAMLGDTYAEFSPSGHGVRAFVQGELGNRKSHAGQGWPFTFETFSTKGFVTFTGMTLTPFDPLVGPPDVERPSPGVRQLMAERFAPRELGTASHSEEVVGLSDEQLQAILDRLDPDAFYDDWLNVAFALHHETRGDGFEIFHDWCARGAKYPGRDELMGKWNSFGKGGHRSITGRYLLKLGNAAGVSVGGPVASPDEFEVVTDETDTLPERRSRFEVVPLADYTARPAPGWIVKGVIPNAELIMAYGPSTAGKTFVVLDITMAIARGVPWRGNKVRRGRVAYICAEGRGGFRNRLAAYCMANNVDQRAVPFGVIDTAPNFLMKEDVKAVTAAIEAAEGAEIIVVDTLAKVTPGANENAGEDMGKAIDNCRKISEATGAAVILVHHMGKDVTRGARGWSGIRAAADAEFEIMRDEASNKRWIEVTKQKDGDDTGRWGFKLEVVNIGMDEDGDIITSCVIATDDPPMADRKSRVKVLGEWEKAVLDAMATLELGDRPVMMPELIEATINQRPDVEGPTWRKRGNIKKAIETLIKSERLWKTDDVLGTREK